MVARTSIARVLSVLVPVGFACAVRRGPGLVAACDPAVVRALGHGYTGVWHGLDALFGLALGPYVGWASVGLVGLLGLVVFEVARDAGDIVALLGALVATLSWPVTGEAALACGNLVGAVLVLAPLARRGARTTWAGLGLAFTYDVPSALGALATLLAGTPAPQRNLRVMPWALVGAIGPVLMLSRRDGTVPWYAGWVGDGPAGSHAAGWHVLLGSLGAPFLAMAACGLIVGVRDAARRRSALALGALVMLAVVAARFGSPCTSERWGSLTIASLGAAAALGAHGMGFVLARVAAAPIPLARASAGMVALLEAVWPLRIADDTSLALRRTPPDATAAWNEQVFSALPRNAVVLVTSDRVWLRARAAAASGALRDDVIVLSAAHATVSLERSLAREPLLGPVLRDLTLYGAPEELSLSTLAARRPLFVMYDGRWEGWARSARPFGSVADRLARHLVPEGAFDRYFIEPRSAMDRHKAPLSPLMTGPGLGEATRDLLAARAAAARATGESAYADATSRAMTALREDRHLDEPL